MHREFARRCPIPHRYSYVSIERRPCGRATRRATEKEDARTVAMALEPILARDFRTNRTRTLIRELSMFISALLTSSRFSQESSRLLSDFDVRDVRREFRSDIYIFLSSKLIAYLFLIDCVYSCTSASRDILVKFI